LAVQGATTANRERGLGKKAPALVLAGLLWLTAYGALPAAAELATYRILGLDAARPLGAAVEFFLYDVPKILLLLGLIVFLVGILRSFFTPERTRRALGGKREGVGNVLAAGLGIVTPFCSCSGEQFCNGGK